jgi:hypothetical protein
VNKEESKDQSVQCPGLHDAPTLHRYPKVLPLLHLFEIVLAEASVYVVGVPIHLDEEQGPVHAR